MSVLCSVISSHVVAHELHVFCSFCAFLCRVIDHSHNGKSSGIYFPYVPVMENKY